MKNEVVEYAFSQFGDALSQLRQGIKKAHSDLEKDGVIQRFEFTFEMFWKALKIYLESQGIETKSPRKSLKEAFRIGLIEDDQLYLDMLEDRNRTSHIYERVVAEEIFEQIRARYLPALVTISKALKRALREF